MVPLTGQQSSFWLEAVLVLTVRQLQLVVHVVPGRRKSPDS